MADLLKDLDFVNAPNMKTCSCCGRWLAFQDDVEKLYCSSECSKLYQQCTICGRHFTDDQSIEGFCSLRCAEEHPEFELFFEETPCDWFS